MANIKISDLTPAAAVLGTQEFEVNDSLTSKKVTAAQILSYINANSGAVDLTSAQTITGVKTFSQPIVGSVTGSAATATTAGNITGTAAVGNGGTGRTSLTANNLLIGAGTSAVNFVAPGTSGNVLTSNGTTWTSAAPAGGAVNTQTFNSNGTWTKPSTGSMARIEVWSGGGGGARNTSSNPAWGGGGGGYVELVVPLSTLSSTVSVTVGAGGTGRTGSTGSGTAGGSSSFGTLAVVQGGAGGATTGSPPLGGYASTPGDAPYTNQTLKHWVGGGQGGLVGGLNNFVLPDSTFGGGMGYGEGTIPVSNFWGGSVFGGQGGINAAGQFPSGGGSGKHSNVNGFNGAAGRVIVTVW
jgi:hypothetical protein